MVVETVAFALETAGFVVFYKEAGRRAHCLDAAHHRARRAPPQTRPIHGKEAGYSSEELTCLFVEGRGGAQLREAQVPTYRTERRDTPCEACQTRPTYRRGPHIAGR